MSKQMNCKSFGVLAICLGGALTGAWASQPASVQGTVTGIRLVSASAESAPTIMFSLSTMPASGCLHGGEFAIAATTDAAVLNNYLAMLLEAKSMSRQIVVDYEQAGSCDSTLGIPRIKDINVI